MAPPKKGIPTIVGLLIIVVVIGVIIGGGWALKDHQMRNPSVEARSSAARATLGAMKDQARISYQRNPELKTITKAQLGFDTHELDGGYLRDEDYTCGGTPEKFWVKCRGVYESEPRDLELTGSLVTGSSTFNR